MKTPRSFLLVACGVLFSTSLLATPEEDAAWRKQSEAALDLTTGQSDICPVHKVKMPVKVVPIQFGVKEPDFILPFKKANSPFGDEFVYGGLNCTATVDPRMPTTGKAFVCPQCIAAWKRFLEDPRKAAESLKVWEAAETKKAGEGKRK